MTATFRGNGSFRQVAYVDLARQYEDDRALIERLVEQVFSSGKLLGGPWVETFEQSFADHVGARHVVAVGSGTDALIFALAALGIGPGDEVVTAPNSFIATAGAIAATGATPVFADVSADQTLDPVSAAAAIGPRTRAILPVHLTGRVADMAALTALARRHGLALVEDCAQAVGSKRAGRFAGTFGEISCFSGHPLKALNAAGDAGWIATDDPALAQYVRRVRNHGLVDRDTTVMWGRTSRLDSLQAALLTGRLGNLAHVIERRRGNAHCYMERLDARAAFIPPPLAGAFDTFHTFVVQVDRRAELRGHLQSYGIDTKIHYPVPIHLQPAARDLGYEPGAFPVAERQAERILSLPVQQYLSIEDIDYVADAFNAFYATERTRSPVSRLPRSSIAAS